MPYQFIAVDRENHITTITLTRPEVMNAINPEMHEELQQAFDEFAADNDQYIAVITGDGERAFCAGSDLKAIAGRDPEKRHAYPASGYAGLIERFDLDKPVIAAVNGIALGGGFEIALAADLIIAAETASFGLPEPRVGAIAIGGGIHRLARQIGQKKAMGLLLTADRVSAAEGEKLGFVNEVVPAGDLKAATRRWCDRILDCAPLAIRATKQAFYKGLEEESLEQAMAAQAGYPAFQTWRHAEDTVEGPRAFAEKRKPRWQGK
ncbi:enoyl-CoA hydratase-related protein [Sneathiella chinensis]|uniref:Enoyl-CoA hydratase n=1 Tax=Sneathiella chinensis TaxID=349750 RepID=A0ABQ5U6F2_9PROT|nr:enoyl-CoA hydratase-related protein [Sneathiella chinensis]GLQ07499.1 enoyl-CoA hydratase [Sneathiella chinensis]